MTVPTKKDSELKLEKYVLSSSTTQKITELAQRNGLKENQVIEILAQQADSEIPTEKVLENISSEAICSICNLAYSTEQEAVNCVKNHLEADPQ